MCGRFTLHLPPPILASSFRLDEVPDVSPSYNIAPAEESLVVGENPKTDRRTGVSMTWGLVPHWAENPEDFTANLINARAETVDEKPAFRDSFRNRRCVVPASGFYEWKSTDSGKTPYYVYPENEDCFGFAGVWDRWTDESGERSLTTFSILTTSPNRTMSDVHDRMPLILDEENRERWLDPGLTNPEKLKGLTDSTFPADRIEYHPVSERVNNPEYDNEDCVQSIS